MVIITTASVQRAVDGLDVEDHQGQDLHLCTPRFLHTSFCIAWSGSLRSKKSLVGCKDASAYGHAARWTSCDHHFLKPEIDSLLTRRRSHPRDTLHRS